MKYKGNKKLDVYVTTYGPKQTRSTLGDTIPLAPPKISKKAQPPENISLQHFQASPFLPP